MKKSIFMLWAILAMAGSFTACTDEDTPMSEQTLVKPVTIRATIDGALGSRVALTDDAINRVVKVDWKQGDDFKINVNGSDYTFTYTANNKFECSNESFPATFTSAGTVTATYPATTPTGYANQPGTLEGAAALLTMTATLDVTAGQSTGNLNLNFKHKNSIVKLTLNNDGFKEKNVTWVTLKSGNSVVATATTTFTGDAENGSIIAYFAVTPQAMKDISILSVCEYNNYTATLADNTLAAGKLYNVTKRMTAVTPMGAKTAATAEKGDLAMADGTFIPQADIATLTDEQKANVCGIVFWIADQTTTATTTPAKLTDDKIMNADYPNCIHGLIVSLKNFPTEWQSSVTNVAAWQKSNAPYSNGVYKSIGPGKESSDYINYILGYQNTKVLKAYNASLESGSANTMLPVSLLANISEQNPAPAKTTGWFIPSVKELSLLCGGDVDNVWYNMSGGATKTAMNTILENLGTDYADVLLEKSYWASSERSEYNIYGHAFVVNFFNGLGSVDYYPKDYCKTAPNYPRYVRAVCAF